MMIRLGMIIGNTSQHDNSVRSSISIVQVRDLKYRSMLEVCMHTAAHRRIDSSASILYRGVEAKSMVERQ
jgi:hypothetical protein